MWTARLPTRVGRIMEVANMPAQEMKGVSLNTQMRANPSSCGHAPDGEARRSTKKHPQGKQAARELRAASTSASQGKHAARAQEMKGSP